MSASPMEIPPTPQAPLTLKTVVMTTIGFLFLALSLPMTAVIVGAAVCWHYVDPVTPFLLKFIGRKLEPVWLPLVRKKEDAFLVNLVLLQAVFIPAFFAYNLYQTCTTGEISYAMAFVYHIIRIGPYFTNFAYAYTLCHKEGHQSKLGMFNKPLHYVIQNVWNYWIGLFYGVMPSTFAYGHSRNHHRYDNDESDVVTTWDRPRDSFLNYVRYLARWVCYTVNLSSILQFYVDKDFMYIRQMAIGTAVYFSFLGLVYKLSPVFAFVYVFYPLLESSLLLSAINWAWHCFLDPDLDNVYAYSVTIFEGDEKTNILNEDYHVVHHQYPGAHWAKHPELYEKHKHEYIANKATCFKDTHAVEIFFLAILKKYDVFAEKFVDVSGKMTKEEIRQLVVTRLRTCSWGELAAKKTK